MNLVSAASLGGPNEASAGGRKGSRRLRYDSAEAADASQLGRSTLPNDVCVMQ
jgi:hypothetical protein